MLEIRTGTSRIGMSWAWASRPCPGERQSGDGLRIVEDGEVTLVVVVDGLGHGPAAAAARALALNAVGGDPRISFSELFARCNLALRRSRGAAMTALRLMGSGEGEWCGVGNVEARQLGPPGGGRDSLVLRPGIVGARMPRLAPRSLRIQPGDRLLIATDGVRRRFPALPADAGDPERIVRWLATEEGSDRDDLLTWCGQWPF